jgi:hypothetical protein
MEWKAWATAMVQGGATMKNLAGDNMNHRGGLLGNKVDGNFHNIPQLFSNGWRRRWRSISEMETGCCRRGHRRCDRSGWLK